MKKSHIVSSTIHWYFEFHFYYNDVTWAVWHLKSSGTRLSVQQLVYTANKCQRQSSALWKLFVRGIHRSPVDSPTRVNNADYVSITWHELTHWGRVTHLCVSKLTSIASDNGLSPDRRQAIIWTNAGILLIGPLGTNFSEILIGIQTFSLKKCTWKCRLRNGVHFVSASMC